MITDSPELVVRLRGLRKTYGATVALDGLDLTLRGGEVLGVAGPNGAGKSTMVGVLAGETKLDSGSIDINGETWRPAVGGQVVVIHQEPQLFGNLTVTENLAVGSERFRFGRPRPTPQEVDLVDSFGLSGVADRDLDALPLSQRQRVEIMRGLRRDANVVLFDEPNSALTPVESNQLFEEVARLADAGKAVIVVSHRLDDLATHCGRIAVIRDGRVHVELEGDQITTHRIAEELVAGVDVGAPSDAHTTEVGAPCVVINDWRHRNHLFSIDEFTVRSGEICAVTGVEGAGGRELVRSLAGLEPTSGVIELHGAIQYVTGDRKGSLFHNLSVEENLMLRSAASIAGRFGWWRKSVSRSVAEVAVDRYGVKVANVVDPIDSLSGGNQQKVAIAGALLTDPAVIALEEPTRGVDIGAKSEIYRHLRTFAADSGAVVLFCTEEAEVFECASRVVVLNSGTIVADRPVSEFDSIEALAGYLAHASSDTVPAK